MRVHVRRRARQRRRCCSEDAGSRRDSQLLVISRRTWRPPHGRRDQAFQLVQLKNVVTLLVGTPVLGVKID
jgi:hypothetical protein